MEHYQSPRPKVALVTLATILSTMIPSVSAQKMYDLPIYRESVDKALSSENLKAVAAKTTDPQVLLGLAFLAKAGSPVRQELSEMAVKAKPGYAPVVAVLAITLDGIDEKSLSELVKRDPDNALGYYLQGKRLYDANSEAEALKAFRKAAACSELRFYESTTGEALFKALDDLNLKERDRLSASSWMATRSYNFGAFCIQPLTGALLELAEPIDIGTREEISDLLLIMAGHLFGTSFDNRWYAQHALQSAFRLKAEVAAAQKSPKMNGYAAVTQALVSVEFGWPGTEDSIKSLELARFLPSRIYGAFAFVDPSQMNAANLLDRKLNLPESDQAAFEKAKENAVKAARALIEVALIDPDGIVGAYLKGLPPSRKSTDSPWVSRYTFVEKLMSQRPDVFKAAATNEEAINALTKAGENAPWPKNMRRMMQIGLGIASYAADHNNTYPDSISVLFEKQYLKSPLEAKSVFTGRPYVYVAAGEKPPAKGSDFARFILLYDDNVLQGGRHRCVFADGHGQDMSMDAVKEQLRKQGK